MSGDRSRLPKWAQTELDRLERDVESWKARATEPDAEDTDTVLEPFWGMSHGHGGGRRLPKGARVRFLVGPNGRDYIDVRVQSDGVLDLSSGDSIAIFPGASNHAYVKVLRHW